LVNGTTNRKHYFENFQTIHEYQRSLPAAQTGQIGTGSFTKCQGRISFKLNNRCITSDSAIDSIAQSSEVLSVSDAFLKFHSLVYVMVWQSSLTFVTCGVVAVPGDA
jgi:hypothetical protein